MHRMRVITMTLQQCYVNQHHSIKLVADDDAPTRADGQGRSSEGRRSGGSVHALARMQKRGTRRKAAAMTVSKWLLRRAETRDRRDPSPWAAPPRAGI